jgi:hypothetical protein
MTFIADLKFGNIYEQDCLTRLKGAKIIQGKFKPYDVIDEKGIKYEVKADRWTYKTHNLCIEFECNNKPSGITSSEADYYMYYIVNTDNKEKPYEYVLKIPSDDIRALIEDKKYHKVQKGGNGWRSKFYLFRDTLFEKYLLSNSCNCNC